MTGSSTSCQMRLEGHIAPQPPVPGNLPQHPALPVEDLHGAILVPDAAAGLAAVEQGGGGGAHQSSMAGVLIGAG